MNNPRILGAFARHRGGAVAMITAFLLPVFIFCTAIAVDTTRIFASKRQLQQSLDAAALAAGKQFGKTQDNAELTRWAKGFFLANARNESDQNTQFSFDGVKAINGNMVLSVSATRDQPTFFGRALYLLTAGKMPQTWRLAVASQIVIENRSVEMALVLDNSGSMKFSPASGGTAKITTLKSAATQLVTQVLTPTGDSNVPNPVKLGIVPFSGAVNVGSGYSTAKWMDTDGLSSSHNDNFDWTTWTTTNLAGVKTKAAVRAPGSATAYRAVSNLEPLSRFYLYRNMKNSNGTLRFPDGWEGCVDSRPNGLSITDTEPSKANPDTLFVPLFAPAEYYWIKGEGVSLVRNNYIDDGSDTKKNESASAFTNITLQNNMNKYFSNYATNSSTDTQKEGPNFVCNTTPITPLTTNMTTAKAAITAMQPSGATNIPEGLAWGWRVLSSREPFTQGVPSTTLDNLKVLVLMTDGENTYNPTYSNGAALDVQNANASMFGTYGFGQILDPLKAKVVVGRMFDATKTTTKKADADNYVDAINEMTTSVCENIKADGKTGSGADGIVIFTIAFDLADSSPIKQRLKACSSNGVTGTGAKLYYDAKNSADLLAAFAAITDEISSLRVSH